MIDRLPHTKYVNRHNILWIKLIYKNSQKKMSHQSLAKLESDGSYTFYGMMIDVIIDFIIDFMIDFIIDFIKVLQ